MIRTFLLLSLLAPLLANAGSTDLVEPAIAVAAKRGLHRTRTWQRLGHYRPALLGGWKSEVDGAKFFLAPDGKTDPQAELVATLRGMFTPGGGDDSVFCRFPARAMWLVAELGIDPARVARSCPRLEDFYARLDPGSITLIFSSYYLNNPASAFGHTFLRVNKRSAAGKRELLDYGIDFAATVDTRNAILYAAKGLFGMFPGNFRRVPYFYKVREYNDYESRDLWEYDLNLSPKQMFMLLAHVWELGQTYFDYFYATENCSYHVLGALEAAGPELELLTHVKKPAVPADTVKALLENAGLVGAMRFRPSLRTLFAARARGLSDEELEAVQVLARSPASPFRADVDAPTRVRVLDAAVDLVDVRHARELLRSESDDTVAGRAKHRLLERRSEIRVPSDPVEITPPWSKMPHRGHGSRRVGVSGGGTTRNGAEIGAEIRLGVHDLADPPAGYPELAGLEYFPTRATYLVDAGRLRLDELLVVRIASIMPWTRFAQRMSWKFQVGATRLADGGCDDCLVGHFRMGGGMALATPGEAVTLFVMSDVEFAGGPALEGFLDAPVRFAIGPSAGLRLRLHPRVVALTTAHLYWLPRMPAMQKESTWAATGGLRVQATPAIAFDVGGRVDAVGSGAQAATLVYF